ncbi:hypothetical protein GRI62_05300 [Erythrobacter arachoides]|uniref:Uracil-DNA glycosylase n=1 Tax=Aurantiacibacter arachoides TaxID=1850444 RepID=A0A845A0F8_9SPHN|nr:hypothetical protein [Aurantiacibacter arachoides]MXO93020.1 hypothetical protein [Aurantiacibacter arachoides]GGD52639.1 hypothetical protein GCM10011411_10660 [Aurantiacibacter arachoides]
MDNLSAFSLADRYSAALDWWRDAGVDCDFADEVQPWLAVEDDTAPEQAARPAKPEPAPHVPAVAESALPHELGAFRAWWTAADNPIVSGPSARVSPRGEAGARLLMLVPMPEDGDRDRLLAGPQGEMLGNIAKAIGIAPDAVYYAAALPAHMPHPDWDDLAREGLGLAVLRHIELARPERVLVFGTKLPALLGHAASPDTLREIAGIPALATFAPERLLEHKRQRALLWERLQKWTAI